MDFVDSIRCWKRLHEACWSPLSLGALGLCLLFASRAARAADIVFNRDVRPILAEHCFACHGQDARKRQADLRLDDRDAAVHADAIVPGDSQQSALVSRIKSADRSVVMPPPHFNRSLTEAQKALLARWIDEGATYDSHWAFTPLVRPALPPVDRADWARNPIDVFVLAKLDEAGLEPSPEADRETLIRRVYLDLVGLLPPPEEVDAFIANQAVDAYETLVERLLASPHYGERMALPWLDAARYADSNGFQEDGDTWQWVWRDWVVRSLNADMPFDRFSTEQLAGDLLPDATRDQLIASAFNRNHMLNGEGGAIPEEQRFNNLFDRVDTTCTTWLGITMACAQCHDHKFDPITQKDYYSLLDAFNRVPEKGVPKKMSSRIFVAEPVFAMPTPTQSARVPAAKAVMEAAKERATPVIEAAYAAWRRNVITDVARAGGPLPLAMQPLLEIPAAKRTSEQKEEFEDRLRKHFDADIKPRLLDDLPLVRRYDAAKLAYEETDGGQIPRVMVMSDSNPRETRVLDRGDYLKPTGSPLSFTTPGFLPPMGDREPRNRLGLARWLFSERHPLTARVQVNRMWALFFGQGIVRTAEDLGVQSEFPRHRELLDWLALEFQQKRWSVKAMHRLLLTSATYRQTSRVTAEQLSRDPENRLFGRAPRIRMPAMILRDIALAASGLLDVTIGGPPVYPYQPSGVWESLEVTQQRDFTYPVSSGSDLYRRSLYTFWRRTVQPVNMFDASNRQTCSVRSSSTSSPLHALTMLNDTTWVEASRALAADVMHQFKDRDGRLEAAFRRVLGRHPNERELGTLREMLGRQLAFFVDDRQAAADVLSVGNAPVDEAIDATELAAMAAVCLGVFNLDEALTRE